MSAAELFLGEAAKAAAKGIVLSSVTQDERELQGVCHELLEVIEGQEYIVEDAQFVLNYGNKVRVMPITTGDFGYVSAIQNFENRSREMISKMLDVKEIAQDLYNNTFRCKRARERAGLEAER